MKDAYSFDIDAAGLDVSYKKHYDVYCRIFDRCGLKYMVVEAHSGAMGGSQSHEFMVFTDAGEDLVAQLREMWLRGQPGEGHFATRCRRRPAASGDGKPELVERPDMKTIEDVANSSRFRPSRR